MERRRRKGWGIGAGVSALAVVLLVAGCSSSSKSASTTPTTSATPSSSSGTGNGTAASCSGIPSGPIKIGNILPLSNNPYSQISAPLNTTLGIAVNYFNQHSNICGHQIQLVNSDDKGDPATSLSLARQYVSEGIKIMLNPSLGPTQDAIQPYLMQNKVLIMGIAGITSYLTPAKNPSYFSVLPSDAQYATATAAAIKTKGWNDVGVLNDGTDFGNDITGYLQKDIQSDGLTLTKTVTYSPTAVDLTAPLQELKTAGAKTVTPASASGITALVSGMKQLGYPSQTLSWGAYLDYFIPASSLPPGTVDGCTWYLPTSSAPSSTTGESPDAAALLSEAAAQLKGASPFGVIQSYIELQMVKAAVEKAGSLDSQQLISATQSLQNVPTVWTGINETFSATDHTGYPDGKYGMCSLTLGPNDVEYLAPGF
jgi:ABC-type branched-subunit amino acid transport system substrate-binding protein